MVSINRTQIVKLGTYDLIKSDLQKNEAIIDSTHDLLH